MPHFLDIDQLGIKELNSILSTAGEIKALLKTGEIHKPLANKQLAMIFEKPSTRTRASFEVGINQLGGNSIILNTTDSQLGRGEAISDTAQVLARYVDIMMLRCFSHQTLLDLAKYSTAPVINGLTDYSHPCQIMADIMTYQEHRGSIKGKTVAWVGDSNNVTTSWVHAAVQFGFKLKISAPKELAPKDAIMAWAKKHNGDISYSAEPEFAARDADLVTTDTWVSMGDKNVEERYALLKDYQVNSKLMSLAKKDALFMHCLPAHRGDEVTEEVIDGKQSVVFDEAENRLHVQKAIMIWCLR
ncbi:MAG: argF [Rickettsiaceae bacterium]|jgi:ornithine carbamoyltransferase|nr:argF [Rickettsiaceae bacterium]